MSSIIKMSRSRRDRLNLARCVLTLIKRLFGNTGPKIRKGFKETLGPDPIKHVTKNWPWHDELLDSP